MEFLQKYIVWNWEEPIKYEDNGAPFDELKWGHAEDVMRSTVRSVDRRCHAGSRDRGAGSVKAEEYPSWLSSWKDPARQTR